MRGLAVYLDVDDVLAETTRAIHALARRQGDCRVAFDEMAVFDLAASLRLEADAHARLWAAIHTDAFLGGLAPMPGAVGTVARWGAAGAEIHVVTGRPPGSRAVTARWLAEAGLVHHRLEIVDKYGRYTGTGGTPRTELAGRDYAIVVEDSVEMADWFLAESDAMVLLVDRPWNRTRRDEPPRLRRVPDWAAIERIAASIAAPAS